MKERYNYLIALTITFILSFFLYQRQHYVFGSVDYSLFSQGLLTVFITFNLVFLSFILFLNYFGGKD